MRWPTGVARVVSWVWRICRCHRKHANSYARMPAKTCANWHCTRNATCPGLTCRSHSTRLPAARLRARNCRSGPRARASCIRRIWRWNSVRRSSPRNTRHQVAAQLVEEESEPTLVDLTGGFGVDFSAMVRGFAHGTYVERQERLCEVARHNLRELGLGGRADVVCGDGVDHLAQMPPATLIYLDPRAVTSMARAPMQSRTAHRTPSHCVDNCSTRHRS